MQNVTGLSGAAPIERSARYHEGLPAQWWRRTAGIVQRVVCQPSGLLPTDQCQEQRRYLVAGTEPTISDNVRWWNSGSTARRVCWPAGDAAGRIEKRL
ncbi:MAG: hypothetical protein H6643_08065 [Caldilineaceae bacterium]|nr:hypothetical protein [Caldilineaceae bacterium]